MFESGTLVSGISVIIDRDQKKVSLVVLQALRIVSVSDLIQSCIRVFCIFQFNKESRFIRISGRWQIHNICVALSGIQFQYCGVIFLRGVIGVLYPVV